MRIAVFLSGLRSHEESAGVQNHGYCSNQKGDSLFDSWEEDLKKKKIWEEPTYLIYIGVDVNFRYSDKCV